MKRNTGDLLRRLQFPLILILGSLPVSPILYTYLKPELELVGWLLPGACLLLAVGGMLLPGRGRLVFGLLCCVGFGALGMLLLRGLSVVVLVPPVLCCGLLLWSLSMASWSWDRELPRVCFWLGVACHVAGQIFMTTHPVWSEPDAHTRERVLVTAFFLFVLLSMLSMNRDSIADANVRRRRVTGSMRWKNMVLTVSFFAIALLLFFIPAVIAAVRDVCQWLVRAMFRLIDAVLREKAGSPEKPDTGGSGAGGGGILSDLPVGDTPVPVALQILERVLQVLVSVVVLAAVAALIWVLLRKVGRLLRLLWGRINRYAVNVAEDYEDVVTDTREEGKRERVLSRFRARRRSRVDERTLSPDQRIRYRYRRLLESHPQWSAGSTARENLPPQAAPLYERARYSDHPVARDDAEQFAAQVRKV